ncbi:MAG TPA: hypothetical protein VKQ54_01915 [Caulobacteraceae bacterium]|nr:hypothetical protein [Caulobacteraceae bacterium]
MSPTSKAPQKRSRRFSFRFTPAEWRRLLDDPAFLTDPDNSWRSPRRLMGVAVEIIPSRDLAWTTPA